MDKTSYSQSLTHMIKGNLGAGLLGMGSVFSHLGLVSALIGMPALCFICCYCVHLLIRAAHRINSLPTDTAEPSKPSNQIEVGPGIDYPTLARRSFGQGPMWARRFSKPMSRSVDIMLLLTQTGVCSVYVVFVVENVFSIFASYHIHVSKSIIFLAIFPITLLLSLIRTLKRLSRTSLVANLLQFVGLILVLEFLVRDLSHVNLRERDKFRPPSEMALGFGSAMFAFEGISVVLPIYARLKRPRLMINSYGVVNVSFATILVLYCLVGLLGFLKYGNDVRDSITLNLPAEPIYDLVRAMFTTSILLTYPLQSYVLNEMIWQWAKQNFLTPASEQQLQPTSEPTGKSLPEFARTIEIVMPAKQLDASQLIGQSKQIEALQSLTLSSSDKVKSSKVDQLIRGIQASTTTAPAVATQAPSSAELEPPTKQTGKQDEPDKSLVRYEYCCRMIVVMVIFALALSVPRLILLMDLFGSVTGACLSLAFPATIHMITFWDTKKGFSKCALIIVDSLIIAFSLCAGIVGSISSFVEIIHAY